MKSVRVNAVVLAFILHALQTATSLMASASSRQRGVTCSRSSGPSLSARSPSLARSARARTELQRVVESLLPGCPLNWRVWVFRVLTGNVGSRVDPRKTCGLLFFRLNGANPLGKQINGPHSHGPSG